jgi:hypothetical protein
MAIIGTIIQQPNELIDYTVDFSEFLNTNEENTETETYYITKVHAEVSEGTTAKVIANGLSYDWSQISGENGYYFDMEAAVSKVKFYLYGGTAGDRFKVTIRITAASYHYYTNQMTGDFMVNNDTEKLITFDESSSASTLTITQDGKEVAPPTFTPIAGTNSYKVPEGYAYEFKTFSKLTVATPKAYSASGSIVKEVEFKVKIKEY